MSRIMLKIIIATMIILTGVVFVVEKYRQSNEECIQWERECNNSGVCWEWCAVKAGAVKEGEAEIK